MKNSIKKIYTLMFVALYCFAVNNKTYSIAGPVDIYNNTVFQSTHLSLDAALLLVGTDPFGPIDYTGVVEVKIFPSLISIGNPAIINNQNFQSCHIYPVGTVLLTTALTGNVILLDNADRVTIDGRLNGTGSDDNNNYLTITASSTNSSLRVIQLQNGAKNNTIRNVNITIPTRTTNSLPGRCINIGQTSLGAAAQGGQDSNTVAYCILSGGDRTLQVFGSSNGVLPNPVVGIVANTNTTFYKNKIRNFSSLGIFIGSDVIDVVCDNNEIYDTEPVHKGGVTGISTAIVIQGTGNIYIRNNRIYGSRDGYGTPGQLSIRGITCIPVLSANPIPHPVTSVTVQNNFVRLDIDNTRANSIYGIIITDAGTPGPLSPGGLDYNAKIYNNTSIIGGGGAAAYGGFTYCTVFDVANVASINFPSTATYYNNVSRNSRVSDVGSQHTGMNFEANPGVTTMSDYNTAFAEGPATNIYFDESRGGFGYNSTFSWRKANCPDYEQHSANHCVNYEPDFHIIATTINYGDLQGKIPVVVTTDLFEAVRDATYPYRGAVEGPPLKVLTVTAGLGCRFGPEDSDMIVALYDGCDYVDYATSYITDTDPSPKFIFSSAVTNTTPYSLRCVTATHLESWSKNTATFTLGLASYIFNSNTAIFGDNGSPSGEFFSGDINQDGIVDGSDMSYTENDATFGLKGCRLSTDVNYDGIVDAGDQSCIDNSLGNLSFPKCTVGPWVDNIRENNSTEKVRLSSDSKINEAGALGF